MSRHQTLVTAAVANAQRVDGIAVEVQFPNYQAEELRYLNITAQEDYPDLESARQRFIDLLHYRKNRLCYRKRTEMAVESVRQLEIEGHFPQAHYAFDNGVLSLPLTRLIATAREALGFGARKLPAHSMARAVAPGRCSGRRVAPAASGKFSSSEREAA